MVVCCFVSFRHQPDDIFTGLIINTMFKRIIFSLLLTVSVSILWAQQYYLFTGTYTNGISEGIYVYRFDASTGQVEGVDTARGIEQPSYLAISENGDYLYAVSETGGDKPGHITAYSFDKSIGKLKLLNTRPSLGDHPCYITVSENRKWVIAGNYSGGNIVAYKVNEDGSLSDQHQLINHEGKSINSERQEAPHVHATVITPDGDYLLAPDLGTDKIMVYRFKENARRNPLSKAKVPYVDIHPGSGPRHLAFHPNRKWVYLMEEMTGEVSGYRYKNGKLQPFDNIDGHPAEYKGSRGSADIHISPDGKNLYTSNRYEANNIGIFMIDPRNGKLKNTGFQDVIGKKPRNFVIEPSGKYVLVANQDTNDIRFFRRDSGSGSLTPTETVITVGSPVCLKLFPY